jgi:hypothetical protein
MSEKLDTRWALNSAIDMPHKKGNSCAGELIMPVNLGFHHLVVTDVNLTEWCRNYDIEIFVGACSKCGVALKVNIPFAGKNRRGLRAAPCQCGNNSVPFTYIDLNFDEINLNSLAYGANIT